MNTTIANRTIVYPTVMQILDKLGNYWWYNQLILYFNTPMSLLGITLNLISFIVYMKIKETNKAMFMYLRYQCFVSMIICLFSLSTIVNGLNRTVPRFYTSRAIRAYYVFGFLLNCNILYIYTSLLNLMVCFDRLASFKGRSSRLQLVSKYPHRISIVSFVVIALITGVYFARYYLTPVRILIGPGKYFNGWANSFSSFGKSDAGKVIGLIINISRDWPILACSIYANISSWSYMKQFMNKKRRILGTDPVAGSSQRTRSNRSEVKTAAANVRMLVMVSAMIFIGIMKHMCAQSVAIYITITQDQSSLTYRIMIAYQSMSFSVYHTFDFFLYYYCNDIFYKKFWELVDSCFHRTTQY